MLRQTTYRDLRVEIFGETFETPLLIAPVGVQSIFHHDKEVGVAEMATQIGVPYILSTASSSSIEDVAEASGNGTRWYQLYWPQIDDITISLLGRAKAAGYRVLVVTLDTHGSPPMENLNSATNLPRQVGFELAPLGSRQCVYPVCFWNW